MLPAYIDKARKQGLPALYLPPIPDVDTMADLMHNITLVEALNYCAQYDDVTPPWRTAQALKEMGWDEVRVPPNDLHDPREDIDKSGSYGTTSSQKATALAAATFKESTWWYMGIFTV